MFGDTTKELVCEGPCNADVINRYDGAVLKGEKGTAAALAPALKHTTHEATGMGKSLGVTMYRCTVCGMVRDF